MSIDDLKEFQRGDRLAASELNVHVELLTQHHQDVNRTHAMPHSCFDPDGWYQRQPAPPPPPVDRHFELKEDLIPGETVEAYLLDWVEGDKEFAINSDMVFDVFDAFEGYRGRAKDKFSTPHTEGSRGYARKHPDTELWEIMWLQPSALMIKGNLTADLVVANGTFKIDSVQVMSPIGAIITDTDPASDVTVRNRRFDGDQYDPVIAVWDEASTDWVTPDVMCPV